jgi:CubicO group peptidase (beta-lactamase class C family)
MLLNGGELDGVQVLSPKTIQLMTTNQLGDIALGYGRGGIGFGLGVGIVLDSGRAQEISSPGTYSWGGAAGTRFWVDPRESLVGIFMVQSVPHMTSLGDDFRVLTYAAMTESQIAD